MGRTATLIAAILVLTALPALKAQELWLDTSSLVMVTGDNSPISFVDANHLTAPLPSTALPTYLAIYSSATGKQTSSCLFAPNYKLSVQQGGNPYLEVTVMGSMLAVRAVLGNFTPNNGPHSYNYQISGYSGGMFQVTDAGGAPQCGNLGNSFDPDKDESLRFSSDPTAVGVVHSTAVDSDDPPIPIIGGSLIFKAPAGFKYSCDSDYSATLTGAKNSWYSVAKLVDNFPPEVHMILGGLDDWHITVYPQQLEIYPGSGTDLKFKSHMAKLDCKTNPKAMIVKTDRRPQQFVVDWSPGWFRSRRYVSIPCGACGLKLGTKAAKK